MWLLHSKSIKAWPIGSANYLTQFFVTFSLTSQPPTLSPPASSPRAGRLSGVHVPLSASTISVTSTHTAVPIPPSSSPYTWPSSCAIAIRPSNHSASPVAFITATPPMFQSGSRAPCIAGFRTLTSASLTYSNCPPSSSPAKPSSFSSSITSTLGMSPPFIFLSLKPCI